MIWVKYCRCAMAYTSQVSAEWRPMKIPILYSTTEGQTAKIVEFVAARLRFAEDDVTLLDAASAGGRIGVRLSQPGFLL